MKVCPNCGTKSLNSTAICECGFNFGIESPSPLSPPLPPTRSTDIPASIPRLDSSDRQDSEWRIFRMHRTVFVILAMISGIVLIIGLIAAALCHIDYIDSAGSYGSSSFNEGPPMFWATLIFFAGFWVVVRLWLWFYDSWWAALTCAGRLGTGPRRLLTVMSIPLFAFFVVPGILFWLCVRLVVWIQDGFKADKAEPPGSSDGSQGDAERSPKIAAHPVNPR
ncbi:MAG TPA: hypothetical protein GYA07_14025 [Verrucomicrobia bacterium]|nr:hypothetical protein [Verrucomicrobiota bacterium]